MTTSKGVWALQIGRKLESGATVISVAGRVAHASAGVFRDALRDVVASGRDGIVVDLSAVDYVSSAGIRALADASGQATLASLPLTVCGLQEPVRLAMNMAGLLPALDIQPSRERALERLEAVRAARRRS